MGLVAYNGYNLTYQARRDVKDCNAFLLVWGSRMNYGGHEK